MSTRLEQSFYCREDVLAVSRELLGKVLCTRVRNSVTTAVITETEAYAGIDDQASHAYGGRRTRRTEPMFGPGGRAYVYLCYGIHNLFNVVTADAGTPHAVLIRAGRPLVGVAVMKRRRGRAATDRTLLAGPGSLARALGITTRLSGTSLTGDTVWIEDHGIDVPAAAVIPSPRVGVDYAGDDARQPWRFRVEAGSLSG
jgi:DNA-3-methyladenine glycosylase